MPKGMGNSRCKGKCRDLEGYEEGFHHFHVEGKGWCQACNYKMFTDYLRCPCCSNKYRRSRRKDYHHLERGYYIPVLLKKNYSPNK